MTKTYSIEIDCANCAAQAEAAVAKMPEIEDALINFMTQKMTLTFPDGTDEKKLLAAVLKTCRRIEPDFCIVK